MHFRLFTGFFFTVVAFGQLIPSGTPIPQTTKPPVVFLNGYQSDCSSADFAGTFGIADQVLQANGEACVFFNNCSVAGRPPIETLGDAFGAFLGALKYDNGQFVTTVDVVAHSMGGLILRSYLSGKQAGAATFHRRLRPSPSARPCSWQRRISAPASLRCSASTSRPRKWPAAIRRCSTSQPGTRAPRICAEWMRSR